MKPQLIAVDWGTTNFRAWLLGAGATILAHTSRPSGIRQVDGPFAAVLDAAVGAWRQATPDMPVLMSGMIGARQGWQEAPYAACPASAAAIAAATIPVTAAPGVHIVPGVAYRPADAPPDVMRGEETQIIGLGDAGPFDGLAVLPGTHSKWVEVRAGVITAFATAMTGEVYALLRQHSILGAMMQDGTSDTAFAAGLAAGLAGDGRGLLHRLFGVRTLGLFGALPPGDAPDYLSGLLIATEIADALADLPDGAASAAPVTIVGAGPLAARYETALRSRGLAVQRAPETVTSRGLWRIARALELVTDRD